MRTLNNELIRTKWITYDLDAKLNTLLSSRYRKSCGLNYVSVLQYKLSEPLWPSWKKHSQLLPSYFMSKDQQLCDKGYIDLFD